MVLDLNFLKKKFEGKKKYVDLILLLLFLFVFSLSILAIIGKAHLRFPGIKTPSPISKVVSKISKIPGFVFEKEIERFSDEKDFKDYLTKGKEISSFGFGIEYAEVALRAPSGIRKGITITSPLSGEKVLPERISETTVQVAGIDEPDIVKTDGENIYFSPKIRYYRILSAPRKESFFPPPSRRVKIIKAFPPEKLALESEIEKAGDLLLLRDKKILVVFSQKEILGYDVSDPKNPKKKWEIELKENTSYLTARLYKDKIYLVSKQRINEYHPCPIRPLSIGGSLLEIKCNEIYHPVKPLPVDALFLAMVIDPQTGNVEKKTSFVGSSWQSIVYMSENSLYITYPSIESFSNFIIDFFTKECRDLFPSEILEKLKRLKGYDISETAKFVEIQAIFEKYQRSLSREEEIKIENEIENRGKRYFKEHLRELEKTLILKIDLKSFKVSAQGKVPGTPLNQFSLDEYKNNLRIATTVGKIFPFGFGGSVETANDVYVLDKHLKIIGKIQNLGLTERIYSVRFIEDKGYVVTFRKIDPFFVIDLSQPQNPKLKGQLKIPGYSSYLHPITKDKILGIGKEGANVKISLFDVSNPEFPQELDKYILKEYWSDVLKTHHAFLLDKKHQIFFLPGASNAFVFSFKGDKLKLEKVISGILPKRAIYLDDYLYIIGERKIVVVDEINWEKVNELELTDFYSPR